MLKYILIVWSLIFVAISIWMQDNPSHRLIYWTLGTLMMFEARRQFMERK